MSMPPEASGPVFTVSRPTRIGPEACARTQGACVVAASAPAPATPWMNFLRLMLMCRLLSLSGTCRFIV